MGNPGSGSRRSERSRVLTWALWDTGAAGLSAIVVTFVFSVYLTGSVGQGLPGGAPPASWLGRALAVAGMTIALLAPLIGVWVEDPHRRRVALTVLTGLAVALTCAMSLIRERPGYLWPGLALLAATAACGDLASVPYNAMLRQLSTPRTSGRISGFGLAAGFMGSVGLLLVVYFGFISGSGSTRGLLHLSPSDGMNVRTAMLVAGGWLAVFALPLLLRARLLPSVGEVAPPTGGLLGGYRKLWTELSAEWRRDRNLVYFVVASAVFRDGLAGVFTFGGVLGVNVYGISPADVLIFGVAASVVAALGAVVGGLVDDRIGSKRVITASLGSIIALCLTMMTLSGPRAFWLCGLLLCLFIGPAQSSARTLLLRMSRDGKEGVAFGLYTMTGRAVSFLAPWLFSVFVDVFGAVRAGIAGLCLVMGVGLVGLLRVHAPHRSLTSTGV
ncbi:MFS transporter [Candidatus Mycobacterium methanotrophicum]|uniref:MFS transporter n=1 Tax=Candidatus Mycobacterium methanotrophicum TaxID=2943498 RepID=A0ABY4QPV8_9MYCO|nr:MFS transporter [Candidatus Mycobacterium methanotrophicum]UQX12656.1 MFS transporter [Candidatus Mycobacterium methanotrophicum]